MGGRVMKNWTGGWGKSQHPGGGGTINSLSIVLFILFTTGINFALCVTKRGGKQAIKMTAGEEMF
ncbi:hypothetical protein [Desulfurispora thermophila]|uniref:hypothetical protein n=1 Tax=Desulfurispora thermophila TaxID=265470 RepID=UPI0003781640|nr:hypothetical protein [Desulfurispora thermophila]